MALSYDETKYLIDQTLKFNRAEARKELNTTLERMNHKIQALYDGVLEHGPFMRFYTSDQWLDFHQKIPHWRLRRDPALMDLLSSQHREILEKS